MRFLFLPLPWMSISLILVTNRKVSIPLRSRTSLAHCNHWPEQPSTDSEVKRVFIWDDKCVIDSRCLAGFQFFFGWFHLPSFGNDFAECFFILFECKLSNVHLASSSPLLSSSKVRSVASGTLFYEWTLLNPGWYNFFTSLQQHEKILRLWNSFFRQRQYKVLQLTFLVFGQASVKSPGGWFSLSATFWSLLQTYLYADRQKLCSWVWAISVGANSVCDKL